MSVDEQLSNLLAVAKDAALEALERGESVAWVGGAVPRAYDGELLLARPLVGRPDRWAVARRAGMGRWFFVAYDTGTTVRMRQFMHPFDDPQKLLPAYLWTLRRVQGALARALGLLDPTKLPADARSAISLDVRASVRGFAALPADPNRARRMGRQFRREGGP